jgi:RNA polymerase sigma-70 factor (ECF subfamily)
MSAMSAADSPATTQLRLWIDRIQAGDLSARDELLRSVCGQLERLAQRLLRRFPSVRRWAETGDVLQNALLRLLRALQAVRPDSMRAFYGLAAEQMRRELLDLARHYQGARGIGANHATWVPAGGQSEGTPEPVDRAPDPAEMERWCAFHEAVARLPAEEREVVGLIFYHGWKQDEVAELFAINVRTVQRRWNTALLKLRGHLQQEGVT